MAIASNPSFQRGRASQRFKDEGGATVRLREIVREGNVALNIWGFASLVLILVGFSLPVHNKADFILRSCCLINSTLFTLRAMIFTRQAVRVSLPVFLFLAIQCWSLISFFVGYGQTGRQNDWGRHMYFVIELSLPYFVSASLCLLNSRWQDKILDVMFWFCCISAFVGFYEFLNLPGGKAVMGMYYEFIVVHNQDIIRPSGLTHHAGVLGYQMVIGLSVCASRIYSRGPSLPYIAGGALMALALIASQAKTDYIPGALLLVIIVGVTSLHSKRAAVLIIALAVVAAALGLFYFRNRLGYAFSEKYSVDSISARQAEWAQNYKAAAPFWLTGLGPDSDMLMSQGAGKYMMVESAYLLFFCMYGIPGFVLFVGSLLSSMWASGVRLIDRTLSTEVRGYSLIILVSVAGLALNAYISNLAIDNSMIQMPMILGGAYVYAVLKPMSKRVPKQTQNRPHLPSLPITNGKRLR